MNCKKSTKRDRKFSGNLHTLYNSQGENMNIPEDVKEAINEMFLCKNLTEHMACFQHFYKELKDCTFVVFSEDEGTELPEALHSNYDNDFAIINIGSANRYYAVNSEIYREMLRTGRSDYYIDVCVELDTQAVSYLKNIFEEYNQIPDCDKIRKMIEYLQLPEVNYSCVPYLVENASKKDVINKIECYKNIKSFMLFKAFNFTGFWNDGECNYDRQEEDIQIDADGLYNDMLSEIFHQTYDKFFEMQKAIYVLLLKTICIEFSNPKKSAKNKIMSLFDFVNEQLGFIAERELEVCYCYFNHDEMTKKFFKKVQRNSNDLLDTINGMAWDLTHIRLIEQQIMFRPTDEVRFAIHMLLTFDNGLKEILQINPIEQIVFYEEIPIPKLKHFWVDNIPDAKEILLSDENKRKRQQTFSEMDVDKLRRILEEELLSLCNEGKV